MTLPSAPPDPDPRPGRVAFGVALVVVVVGLFYLGFAPQHWFRGVLVVAAGVTLLGLVRLTLPDRRAGPLLVRGRWFDGGVFVVVGVLMAVFGVMVR